MGTLETSDKRPLPPEGLEERLRSLARTVLGATGVDDLELKHLLEILTRSSLLLNDVYDPVTLGRILEVERRPSALIEPLAGIGGESEEDRRFRLWGVPDLLRTCGDKCLYDVGLAGRRSFRGFDLTTLGPRSYSLASQVLELLADDRVLRGFFDRNLLERLPIDEEILFLRQCASRFAVYARILQAFRGPEGLSQARLSPGAAVPGTARVDTTPETAPATRREPIVTLSAVPPGPLQEPASSRAAAPPPGSEEGLRGLDRDERLARYERSVLFSALDIPALRARLTEMVVHQQEAVDQICDDMAVFALGTHGRPRPQSYLMVGPTGVGKNHLVDSLVRLLEETWGVDVPLLLLEGPQYTYPSDVGELKGSTRGFIRSDEEGLLGEFHERARRAPLSFILVDEIEKAHAQLARFFLSLMDRGSTMDNRGRLLRFPATILAFTSNIGYSEEQMLGESIGYGAARRAGRGRRGAAARNLKRSLPPEFLNRLRVLHFAPLSRDSAQRILDQEAGRIASRYRALHGVDLAMTEAARQALVDRGFSEEYGARHLVRQADRVLNVEVSLRLHTAAGFLSEEGRRLLALIREAREGGRAVDEEALRSEVSRQTRLRRAVRRITVDWQSDRFVYAVEEE